jgi:hypothetical protein
MGDAILVQAALNAINETLKKILVGLQKMNDRKSS